MEFDFSANPGRSVRTEYVGRERQPVLVLDDFALRPAALVNLAIAQQFVPSGSPYPGMLGPLHPDYVTAVLQAIRPLIGTPFALDSNAQAKLYSCFFGLVTTPPDQLKQLQRQPHIDTPDPGRLAVLHYLCDPSHGGTAFYRHRETGWESLDARQHQHVMARHAADQRPSQAGYISVGNAAYERTGRIEARFNRLLVYRSRVLHCAEILRPDALSADPRTGRLTANLFLEFPQIGAHASSTNRPAAVPAV